MFDAEKPCWRCQREFDLGKFGQAIAFTELPQAAHLDALRQYARYLAPPSVKRCRCAGRD
jgi:hypothetical protein